MSHRGACLCGRVRYEVRGPLDQPVACHCSQCARTSGNFAVMACARLADLHLIQAETLTWFHSSALVRRGFCAHCGSNLFWTSADSDETYVTAGTLDPPTALRVKGHIFVGSKSDFYEIADDLPRKQEW